MARLFINESDHATKGFIVATFGGQIVWSGPGKDFAQARGYDAIHCHPETDAVIRAAAAKKNIQTNAAA